MGGEAAAVSSVAAAASINNRIDLSPTMDIDKGRARRAAEVKSGGPQMWKVAAKRTDVRLPTEIARYS